jgi:hypothetical protein
MLKMLLAHRTGIGQVLGIVACTATAICFEYFFEWTWFAAIPVGVLHYFVSSLLGQSPLGQQDRQSRIGDGIPYRVDALIIAFSA